MDIYTVTVFVNKLFYSQIYALIINFLRTQTGPGNILNKIQ